MKSAGKDKQFSDATKIIQTSVSKLEEEIRKYYN